MHVQSKPQHLLPRQTTSSFWCFLLNKWHHSAIRLWLPKSKSQDQVLHFLTWCRNMPSQFHLLMFLKFYHFLHPHNTALVQETTLSLLDSSSSPYPCTPCPHKWESAASLQPIMCFTALLLISPLDCKEIQPVHPKGDQSWVLSGRTNVEAETPILWPPDAKSWFIWKDPDAGKDWGQEEKRTTEDEMVGWHHQLNGQEFGWILGVGYGQGGLACCSSWGRKESDTTELLNWTELLITLAHLPTAHRMKAKPVNKSSCLS